MDTTAFLKKNLVPIIVVGVMVLAVGTVVAIALHNRRAFHDGCEARGGHVLVQGHGYSRSRLCVTSDGRLLEVPR